MFLHRTVLHSIHSTHLTIGQLPHSQTDPLGHAATAADRDTQSTRGLQAAKIADSSDNFHVFATGSKEERPTRFTPLGSKEAHEQLRQNRLQPLQTLIHRQ